MTVSLFTFYSTLYEKKLKKENYENSTIFVKKDRYCTILFKDAVNFFAA
jgi:hypothetical protein